jgi:hypothetical protein
VIRLGLSMLSAIWGNLRLPDQCALNVSKDLINGATAKIWSEKHRVETVSKQSINLYNICSNWIHLIPYRYILFWSTIAKIFLHLWNDMRTTFYNNRSSGVPQFHVKARDETWSTGAVFARFSWKGW